MSFIMSGWLIPSRDKVQFNSIQFNSTKKTRGNTVICMYFINLSCTPAKSRSSYHIRSALPITSKSITTFGVGGRGRSFECGPGLLILKRKHCQRYFMPFMHLVSVASASYLSPPSSSSLLLSILSNVSYSHNSITVCK